MNIKLITFDWSGVISDDRIPVYGANMQIARDYGKKPVGFKTWLSMTTMNAAEFLKKFGVNEDPEKLFQIYEERFDQLSSNGHPPKIYSDVKETLEYLKERKIRMAILSSHPKKSLEQEAQRYGIANFFQLTLASSRNKIQGLETICRTLQTPPHLTLYIGDSIHDIRAAKKANVKSAAKANHILKLSGYHKEEALRNENPDVFLQTLSELKTVVEKIT